MTAVSKPGSMIVDWLKPSYLNLETQELLSSSEIADVVEAGANICEWTHVLTGSEYAHDTAEKLETLEQVCALPAFVEKLGGLKNSWTKWDWGQGTGKFTKVVQNGLMVVNKGAKSSFFFNSIDLIPLKDNLKVAKGIFWSTLGVVDSISVFDSFQEMNKLDGEINKTRNAEWKSILGHRWTIAALNIAKSVNCIAQAAIALVSILFVSLAHGIIFSPLVFLGLTSSWLILNFGTHFYEKIVDRWAAKLPPTAVRA
jgi:hypothetical protein